MPEMRERTHKMFAMFPFVEGVRGSSGGLAELSSRGHLKAPRASGGLLGSLLGPLGAPSRSTRPSEGAWILACWTDTFLARLPARVLASLPDVLLAC